MFTQFYKYKPYVFFVQQAMGHVRGQHVRWWPAFETWPCRHRNMAKGGYQVVVKCGEMLCFAFCHGIFKVWHVWMVEGGVTKGDLNASRKEWCGLLAVRHAQRAHHRWCHCPLHCKKKDEKGHINPLLIHSIHSIHQHTLTQMNWSYLWAIQYKKHHTLPRTFGFWTQCAASRGSPDLRDRVPVGWCNLSLSWSQCHWSNPPW